MKTKSVILSVVILVLSYVNSYGQYTNILISNQYMPNEVTIMINPKNTNQIVAGSNINIVSSDSSGSGYYYSTNGGLNWTTGILHSAIAQPSGDPVIVVDTAGIFYYIQNANGRLGFDRHLVMKSFDGGITWPTGSYYGKDGNKMQDKPWGCVDWSNSIYRNNIYVTWTEFSTYYSYNPLDSSIILFTRSTDGGMNWSTPVRLCKRKGDSRDSCNTMEGAVPCTGPNGEIYVSWSGPIALHSGQYAIFFNKSTDGGITWLDSERVATSQPGGWDFFIPALFRCNGFPVTCCDLSNGPNRGTIYINFSDQRNGTFDTDVWLIKSTNGGVNWSSPKRVNNDGPGNQQFFNWMTVDQKTGYIYVVFYDQRNISAYTSNVYIARSTDGGENFFNAKVTNSPFQMNGGVFFGDYINVSAYNNVVRPVWMQLNGNALAMYTAIVDTFRSTIEHVPLQSTSDTVPRNATANFFMAFNIPQGANSPRLYYKSGSNPYSYVNAVSTNGTQYTFTIPGFPRGTRVSYYLAVQDSSGSSLITFPSGGGGVNPPGIIPPSSVFTYDIFTNFNQCSNTLPKPINDNQPVYDTINPGVPGYVNKVTVNLTITHQNDGDLIIQLINSGNTISLSQRNGQGGQNYTNTTFDDDAALSITQGSPPFSGPYKPQVALSNFKNFPVSGNWILKVSDVTAGNTGTLNNWCVLFQVKNSIGIQEEGTPVKYELSQNYPNPFNSSTRISYSIPKSGDVSLKIYDMLGREVRILVNEYQNAGNYVAMFNAGELASGIYYYRLSTGDISEIKKMVVIK